MKDLQGLKVHPFTSNDIESEFYLWCSSWLGVNRLIYWRCRFLFWIHLAWIEHWGSFTPGVYVYNAFGFYLLFIPSDARYRQTPKEILVLDVSRNFVPPGFIPQMHYMHSDVSLSVWRIVTMKSWSFIDKRSAAIANVTVMREWAYPLDPPMVERLNSIVPHVPTPLYSPPIPSHFKVLMKQSARPL